LDAYLRDQGQEALIRLVCLGGDPLAHFRREFGSFGQDSLGTFCFRRFREWYGLDELSAGLDDEGLRCLGVLELRRLRSGGEPPRVRMVVLRSQGLKHRALGVPSALVFVEGTWIRSSAQLLPRKHWVVRDSSVPTPLSYIRQDELFASLDLSRATDGLTHRTIDTVLTALVSSGLLRSSDLEFARWGMGTSVLHRWEYPGLEPWDSRRGSPMGTPLSFVVLSWVNSWATDAFNASATHGDDAVGLSTVEASEQSLDYALAVEAVGGAVNASKTFYSSRAYTFCEFAGFAGVPDENNVRKVSSYFPPPIPPPGSRQPPVASDFVNRLGLRRSERVVRTLFPWVHRDPRLHLPASVGGLGYTGRGLAVSKSVRCRLAAACSGVDALRLGLDLAAKRPFREAGHFPKRLVQVPRAQGSFYRHRDLVLMGSGFQPDPEGELVLLSSFIVHRESAVTRSFLYAGGEVRRVDDSGRPPRTRRSALFKSVPPKRIRPIGKLGGRASLEKLARRLSALCIRVDRDIASRIRDRIPESAWSLDGAEVNL